MFDGKVLYNPKGRSGEYARWALNFYNGCSGNCAYCYNKRFPILSNTTPTLKKGFKDDIEAENTAIREITTHKDQIIQDGGVFMSFVSDPMLPETMMMTRNMMLVCCGMIPETKDDRIPLIILTKNAGFVNDDSIINAEEEILKKNGSLDNIAIGFTLTGHDEMEPGCSPNEDRIKAMKILRDKGYRTWASIEPIIDFPSSLRMIEEAAHFCSHFKIGLRTDKKFETTIDEAVDFVNWVRKIANDNRCTIYWKESFRSLWGGGAPIGLSFVEADYNMFNQKP